MPSTCKSGATASVNSNSNSNNMDISWTPHRRICARNRCQASCPSMESGKNMTQQQSMKRPKWQLTPQTNRKLGWERQLLTPLQGQGLLRQRSFSSFVIPNDVQELFQDVEMVPHYVFELPALTRTSNFKQWAKANTQRASLIIGMYMRAARGDDHLPSGINCCGYCLLGHHPKHQLPVCPGCLRTQYCSRKCQQKHWMFHKKYCKGCA